MEEPQKVIVYRSTTEKNTDEFVQELAKHPVGCGIAFVVFVIACVIVMKLQGRRRY